MTHGQALAQPLRRLRRQAQLQLVRRANQSRWNIPLTREPGGMQTWFTYRDVTTVPTSARRSPSAGITTTTGTGAGATTRTARPPTTTQLSQLDPCLGQVSLPCGTNLLLLR